MLKSEINKVYPFSQFKEAMEDYEKNMTAGKIIFKPSTETSG
jgi:NADPH:quinone reductase-like Zn-dependent oxidoreductase